MADLDKDPPDAEALRRFFGNEAGRIRAHRRALHRIPELGFSEFETSAYIKGELDALGVAYQAGVGGTGTVARIGRIGGPRVAIRADMDGLPIREEGEGPYASIHEGRMHACGHDAHSAMLLGTAAFFKSVETTLPGEVLLVFQPAEERSDGAGLTGARHILGSGLLQGVRAVLGAHVSGDLPAGSFGILPGAVTASGDMFQATIHGRGGHDAFVHRTVDPIFLAVQALGAIYALRSRKRDPMEYGTVSVGTIEAGTTANVIPDSALITGTIRSFAPEVREIFLAELEKALKIAETLGGSHDLEIRVSVPETRNDAVLAAMAREMAVLLYGEECLRSMEPIMGVEDFSWYSTRYPSLFVILGTSLGDGVERPFHSPRFDIDDSVLYRGSALLSLMALEILSGGAKQMRRDRTGSQ